MKKYAVVAGALLCAGCLWAADDISPGNSGLRPAREKTAAGGRTAVKSALPQAPVAQASAAAGPVKSAAPDGGEAGRAAASDSEESGVVIDDKSDDGSQSGSYASKSGAEQGAEEAVFGSSIPASYGKLMGVINEPGRNVLVFESDEDGALSFVHVTVGKNSVSWKLAGRVSRSQE